MNDMGLLGSFFAGASRRAARFVDSLSHPHIRRAWQAAIRSATLSGWLFAFALLLTFSTRANAAPSIGRTSQVVLADDSRHAAASASASNGNGPVVFDESGRRAKGAAIGRQPWLWALSIVVVVALITCLLRAALRRAAGQREAIANERACPCESTEATNPNDHEPFEQSYLDALSEEGIDLPVFLTGWRRAMDDDLYALASALHCQRDPIHVRGLLHRLSGAVGLVGARGLMEAMRRASVSPLDHDTGLIEALIDRARNLVEQLEPTPVAHRNTQP